VEVKRSLTTVQGTFNLPTEEDDTNMEWGLKYQLIIINDILRNIEYTKKI